MLQCYWCCCWCCRWLWTPYVAVSVCTTRQAFSLFLLHVWFCVCLLWTDFACTDMKTVCRHAGTDSVWDSYCLLICANSQLAKAEKIDCVLNVLHVSGVHLRLLMLLILSLCVMIHVSFSVLLCICWCTAGEHWLRDMDLAHWVCELWLNPWVYCFRHALTTSPQWPGSRLHSSRGGPLLTHSHPLLPLPPPSLPPLIPSLFPLYPPSPLYSTLPLLSTFLNLSLHAVFFCFFFTTPPVFPSLSISMTLLSTRQKLPAGIWEKQVLQTCQWKQTSCL